MVDRRDPFTCPFTGRRSRSHGGSRLNCCLPFDTLGANGSNDYFADGLTEDIISALGRFRDLSMMSLGAVFAYKGKHPPPAEVGRDLKVRYVVEGFIRLAAVAPGLRNGCRPGSASTRRPAPEFCC
jgi:hypothetical protein